MAQRVKDAYELLLAEATNIRSALTQKQPVSNPVELPTLQEVASMAAMAATNATLSFFQDSALKSLARIRPDIGQQRPTIILSNLVTLLVGFTLAAQEHTLRRFGELKEAPLLGGREQRVIEIYTSICEAVVDCKTKPANELSPLAVFVGQMITSQPTRPHQNHLNLPMIHSDAKAHPA